MTNILGIKSHHSIITDDCRIGRTDMGAFEEAVERMRKDYISAIDNYKVGFGAKFNMVLTIENPNRKESL